MTNTEIINENKELANQIFEVFGYFCAKSLCYPNREEIATRLTAIYFDHKKTASV
jgi:superfamily II DNA/RNA helicase